MTSTETRRPSPNRYLAGNFAPVDVEHTEFDLSVTGTIPDYLDGRYLRNGPNPIEADPATYQWFLGSGMVHGLRLSGGKAQWYRNRWVRSADVSQALGEEPIGPTNGPGMEFGANTNVIGHAGRTLAIVEAGARCYELTDELDTIGSIDFGCGLAGGYTAHPKLDPASGELHAVSYNPFRGNRVRYTVTGVDGAIRRSVEIPMTSNPMMHDFSLTENYVVIYDLPVVFDLRTAGGPSALMKAATRMTNIGLPKRAVGVATRMMRHMPMDKMGLPYSWDPNHQARLGVLRREADPSTIQWFDIDPCFVYHPMNAYDHQTESGTEIVLDVARHDHAFKGIAEPIQSEPTLERFTVNLGTSTVTQTRLDDRGQEFPRVDERLVGRPHRYGYTVGFSGSDPSDDQPEAVVKHDLHRQSTSVRGFGPDREPSEFVFVPASPDAAEDDGVAMGFVYNKLTDTSDLVLLDAQTLDTVAEIALPGRVPNGFHGNWIPAG